MEQNPDDAQYYCQRAYCHILLGKYHDGIADVKKSLELNPNNPTAILRKGYVINSWVWATTGINLLSKFVISSLYML